jgi:hypothetical protein
MEAGLGRHRLHIAISTPIAICNKSPTHHRKYYPELVIFILNTKLRMESQGAVDTRP